MATNAFFMKKNTYLLALICITCGLFTSCVSANAGTHRGDCPSHDKNYFMKR